MSQCVLTIFRHNNTVVFWQFASSSAERDFVNDATVTMSLFAIGVDEFSDASVPVTGVANLPMTYQAGSNGEYQGVIPFNLDWDVVVAGAGYHLRITATGTENARRTLDAIVVERTC